MTLPCDNARCSGKDCEKKDDCMRQITSSDGCYQVPNLDPTWCIAHYHIYFIDKEEYR